MRVRPPGILRVNRGLPISRGLVGLWAPTEGGTTQVRDLSGNGRNLTIGGNSTARTRGVNNGGVGSVAKFSTFYSTTDAVLKDVPLNNFTIVYVGSASAHGTTAATMAWHGTDDLLFYCYGDNTGGGNAFRVFWRDVGGTGTLRYDGTFSNRLARVFGLTSYGAADHRTFLDGAQVATMTSSRSGAGPFTGFAIQGWADNGGQGEANAADSVGNLYAVWRRALSPQEHAALAVDPWLMFREPRVIAFAPSADTAPTFRRTTFARAGSRGVLGGL